GRSRRRSRPPERAVRAPEGPPGTARGGRRRESSPRILATPGSGGTAHRGPCPPRPRGQVVIVETATATMGSQGAGARLVRGQSPYRPPKRPGQEPSRRKRSLARTGPVRLHMCGVRPLHNTLRGAAPADSPRPLPATEFSTMHKEKLERPEVCISWR